jgi:hypothetical protein
MAVILSGGDCPGFFCSALEPRCIAITIRGLTLAGREITEDKDGTSTGDDADLRPLYSLLRDPLNVTQGGVLGGEETGIHPLQVFVRERVQHSRPAPAPRVYGLPLCVY